MRLFFTLIAATTLVACSGETMHDGHSEAPHENHAMAKGIVISNARVLPPFPGKDTAAAYFEIANHGPAADRLVSVSSPISDAVEIHNHIEEDGVMKMRMVKDGIALAPGASVELRPGSYHIMMFKAELPDNQDDVALTLTYENAESVTVIAPVEGRGDEAEDEKEDHSNH